MTARVQSRAPSFTSTLLTWRFTVSRLRNSRAAISVLDRPAATCRRTSASRAVSSGRAALPRTLAPRAGVADDGEVGLALEQHPQAGAHQDVVVDEHQSQRAHVAARRAAWPSARSPRLRPDRTRDEAATGGRRALPQAAQSGAAAAGLASWARAGAVAFLRRDAD